MQATTLIETATSRHRDSHGLASVDDATPTPLAFCAALLFGVFVFIVLLFGRTARRRMTLLHAKGLDRCTPVRDLQPTTSQVVRPTALTKAILWPLGRPWETGREEGWPNCFAVEGWRHTPLFPSRSFPGATMLAWASSSASFLWWRTRSELRILRREIAARLAGRHGDSLLHLVHPSLHSKAFCLSPLEASLPRLSATDRAKRLQLDLVSCDAGEDLVSSPNASDQATASGSRR